MNDLIGCIRRLVARGDVRISAPGYDQLASDDLCVRDVIDGLASCELVREYPDYGKGPCVLVLVTLDGGRPVHAVWGIPKGKESPAVLVTAYRPDTTVWESDFMTRRKP